MNQRKIDAVADALAEAHRNGGTVAELDEALLPKNWQEAFQVQDALDERLGFEVAGLENRLYQPGPNAGIRNGPSAVFWSRIP